MICLFIIFSLSEKYNDFREIDWKELAKQFDSYTHQRLYRIFNDLITTKVPKEDRKNFKGKTLFDLAFIYHMLYAILHL